MRVKRWKLALLAVIAAVFVLIPMTVFADTAGSNGVFAEEYPVGLWVGGTQLTESGQTVAGNTGNKGTATLTYDDDGNPVLTLNDFKFTGVSQAWCIGDMEVIYCNAALYYYDSSSSPKPLKIVLKGQNEVKNQFPDSETCDNAFAIYSNSSISISSESNTNKLAAEAGRGGLSAGIYAEGGITIEGGSVTAQGGKHAAESVGLYAYGDITINNGNVNAYGADYAGEYLYLESVGIDSRSSVLINGGKVEAKGGTSKSDNSIGIHAASDLKITDGEVIAAGGKVVSNTRYNSIGLLAARGDLKITGGKVDASGGTIANDDSGSGTGMCVSSIDNGIIFDWDSAGTSYPEIKSTSYSGKVTLNRSFYNVTDKTVLPSGQLENSAAINGKTLIPYITIEHNGINFTPWADSLSLPSQGDKNYYLTKNVDLGGDCWEVPAGTTGLFLNGHSITSDDDDAVIILDKSNSTLNLYDEKDNAGKITSTKEDGVLLEAENATFNMYGGEISGCDDYGVNLDESGDCFHMYGGKISGCYDGVGIFDSGASFTLHDGEISNNKSYGVNAYGSITIENGSVTKNRTGIKTYTGANAIILQGNNIAPVITGNTEKNLLLDRSSGAKIKVNEGTTISGNAKIGVYPTNAAGSVTGIFTDGLSGKIPDGKTAADIFISDVPKHHVETSNGEAALVADPEAPNQDPVGGIDAVVDNKNGSIWVQGWAFDPSDMTKAIDVHVYIGGEAGTSGAEGHAITANAERTDVNNVHHCGNYHGFDAVISTNKRGEQTVYIYGINIGDGVNTCIGSKTVTITNPSTDLATDPTTDPATDPATDKKTEPTSTELSEIKDLSKIKIIKPKAAKKTVTVKWKKVSKKNLKKIKGIEIQVATDKNFTNIVKSTSAGKKKTSKKVGGLRRKTKYWVRIRAYRNDVDGKHVSAWKKRSFRTK